MEFIICVKANQKVRITQIMEFMIYVSHKTYVTTIQKKQVKNKINHGIYNLCCGQTE